MHQIKHLFKDYFVFSKRERRALFILFIIVFILLLWSKKMSKRIAEADQLHIVSKPVNNEFSENNYGSDNTKSSKNDHQKNHHKWDYKRPTSYNNTALFVFNPNTANEGIWLKLGVKESVINTIMKYREKGGVFRKPEDLRRIFGLPPALCEKLIPFVRIPEQEVVSSPGFPKSRKLFTTVNINQAAIEDWKILQGIGPGYAQRIINFREKLGGFYSVEQVAETYGLPDSVFQKIKPRLEFSSGPYRKINLNEVLLDELKKHPYIDFRTANNIVSYRSQHGAFESVEDLRKIASMPPDIYEKIQHYLSVK